MTWICCSNHVFPFPSTSLDPQVLQEIRGRNREIAGETDQWLAKGQSTAPGTGEFHDSGSEPGIFSKFFFKTYFPLVKAVHHLESTFFQRPSAPRKVGAKRMARVISNDLPIKAPRNLTVLDNTLLFLPEKAVREFNLEPNMNDKGDEDRGFLTRRRGGGVVSRFFWGWPNKFFFSGILGMKHDGTDGFGGNHGFGHF